MCGWYTDTRRWLSRSTGGTLQHWRRLDGRQQALALCLQLQLLELPVLELEEVQEEGQEQADNSQNSRSGHLRKRDKKKANQQTSMASAASSSSVLKDVQVAIVGAGVAGLQCAQTLLKAGVTSVVVLEATSVVGGYETIVVATHRFAAIHTAPFVGWLSYWL